MVRSVYEKMTLNTHTAEAITLMIGTAFIIASRRAGCLCFPCRSGGGAFSRPPLTRLLGHEATSSKRQ